MAFTGVTNAHGPSPKPTGRYTIGTYLMTFDCLADCIEFFPTYQVSQG